MIIEDSDISIKDGNIPMTLPSSLSPAISQYLIVGINAANTGSVEYPTGTVAILWENIAEGRPDTEQQRFKIYVDGSRHNYYVPLGVNLYWAGSGQETKSLGDRNNPDNLSINIPSIEGVDIRVRSIALKDRVAFPLDIFIEKILTNLSGDSTRTINPLLIPVYLLVLLFLILAAVFYFMFRTILKKKDMNSGIIIKKASFIFILIILLGFSANYIYTEIITVRSYWNSYKSYILSGKLDQTYMGFYDFEKFIQWVDDIIPPGENIIVYVRGEPVYIMSEMAYNLYPRDIKFINISNKTYNDINSEIESINEVSDDPYNYVVVLSEDDSDSAFRFELISRYRVTGGFVYRIDG